MKILIINGPNLNLLGKREPDFYGNNSFETHYAIMTKRYPQIELSYFQSNIEGEIIDKIHETGFDFNGIILNAGGYTHTSVAIRDAIKSIKTAVIEVHISNTHAREEFRHASMLSGVCRGVITGFGMLSYDLAVEATLRINNVGAKTL